MCVSTTHSLMATHHSSSALNVVPDTMFWRLSRMSNLEKISENVPLIPPIFTYNTEFGEVRVYVFRGMNDTFLVATLNGNVKYQYAVSDHTSYHKKRRVIEYPYAIVTLLSLIHI